MHRYRNDKNGISFSFLFLKNGPDLRRVRERSGHRPLRQLLIIRLHCPIRLNKPSPRSCRRPQVVLSVHSVSALSHLQPRDAATATVPRPLARPASAFFLRPWRPAAASRHETLGGPGRAAEIRVD